MSKGNNGTLTHWTELPFDHVNRGEFLSSAIVLPIVCVVCVALRFLIRRLQRAKIEIDDWLIVLACLCIVGMGVCSIVGFATHELAYPMTVPGRSPRLRAKYLHENVQLKKIEYAQRLIMVPALGLVKLSIIMFLRRIFLVYKKSAFGWISAIMGVLISIWMVGLWFWFMFLCRTHIDKNWAVRTAPNAVCGRLDIPQKVFFISDLVLETAMLILPLPLIWTLQMSKTRKIAISGVFMFGLSSVAASATRLAIYVISSKHKYNSGMTILDNSEVSTNMLWWNLFESSTALIAACLPTLWFLFSYFTTSQPSSSANSIASSSRKSLLGWTKAWRRVRSQGSATGQSRSQASDDDHHTIDDKDVTDSTPTPTNRASGSLHEKQPDELC